MRWSTPTWAGQAVEIGTGTRIVDTGLGGGLLRTRPARTGATLAACCTEWPILTRWRRLAWLRRACFRLQGSVLDGLAAFGLCLIYAIVFTVVFIVMGLFAPSAQAAQGMSLIAFVFAFISSAYVPAASMPGWLQPFSKYQPITPMVDAVRSLLVGSSSDLGLALAWSALLITVFTPIAVLRYRRA